MTRYGVALRPSFAILASLCLFISACSGKDGADGPTGPAGPTGNANVKSKVVTLTNTNFSINSTIWLTTGTGTASGYLARVAEVAEPAITADIFTNGMVLVYFKKYADVESWTPLPFSMLVSTTYNRNYVYEVVQGKIRFFYYFTPIDASVVVPSISTTTVPTHNYKYVIVQGAALSAMRLAKTDLSNPEAVEAFLASK